MIMSLQSAVLQLQTPPTSTKNSVDLLQNSLILLSLTLVHITKPIKYNQLCLYTWYIVLTCVYAYKPVCACVCVCTCACRCL